MLSNIATLKSGLEVTPGH